MINEQELRRLLVDEHMTHGQAALALDVSIGTAGRAIKKYGLQAGRGVRHRWEFQQVTEPLAYVLGTYLTDGTATKSQLSMGVVSTAFRNHFAECLMLCDLPVSLGLRSPHASSLAKQDQATAACYSAVFAQWLLSVCDGKDRIPSVMFDAPNSARLEFLAAVIDGDGQVTRDGSIRVRKSKAWINDLPDFVSTLGIRARKNQVGTLSGDRPYWMVSINRSDYRALGGTCYIPEKAERILTAKDPRSQRQQRPVYYPCAQCGTPHRGHGPGTLCQPCYFASDAFHEHLRTIAPAGNIAANIARWGQK